LVWIGIVVTIVLGVGGCSVNEAVGAASSVGELWTVDVSVGEFWVVGITVVGVWTCEPSADGIDEIQIETPISTKPVMLEKILGSVVNFGTTISFAFTPPPNTPIRRAAQPARARITGKFIRFSIC